MLEGLFELLFEFFVEVILQPVFELLGATGKELLRRYPWLRVVLAVIFIPLTGGLIGLFFSNMIPERIIPTPRATGISLFLSPMLAGLAMKYFGDWRRNNGHQPTLLATFWGGALFAFSMALVRWLRVARVVG